MNSLQKLSTSSLKYVQKNNFFNNIRLLYSPSSLKIDSFIQRKQLIQKEKKMDLDLFRKKLQVCVDENNSTVFSFDVTKMVYLAENKEDLDLIHKLIKKLQSQKFIKVQNYNYGIEVMKLHYVMNRPLEAMLLVSDPLLYSKFHSSASFLIFLDLLYENNLYEEIIKMYNYRLEKSSFTFFAPLHIIYFAACYKLSTKAAFENAFKVWQTLQKYNYKPGLRIRLLYATLSLNLNQLFCAMEVLPLNLVEGVSASLKCLVLAKSKRYDDVIEMLKGILESNKKSSFILKEILTALEKELHNIKEKSKKADFQSLKEDLFNANKVKDESLDSCLFAKLDLPARQHKIDVQYTKAHSIVSN